MRPLFAMALADLQERTRRYSFFVTLIFAVYLGYGVATGLIQMHLEDARGVFNSAWIGASMTAVATTFLALVGFYVTKNTVERDRQTGVGQILATTPLTRVQYTLGKTVSNFLVLVCLLAVLAAAGFVMQMWRGEERTFNAVAFFAPMFWVALPALFLVAAIAVFFETMPGLGGGFGNVAYFFLWGGLIAVSAAGTRIDPSGFHLLGSSMREAASAAIPGYDGGISLTINPGEPIYEKTIVWNGIPWTPAVMLSRLPIVAAGIAVALLAALPFDRFDTTRQLIPSRRRRKGNAAEAVAVHPSMSHTASVDLPAVRYRPSFLALTLAEIWLMLRSTGWRWRFVAAGLLVAQFFTPFAVSRGPLLWASWLWPLMLWSAMGSREKRFGTEELVFTGSRFLSRQFAAVYLAGVLVALLSGLGAGVRSVLAGDPVLVGSFFAGALFVPALSLACGAWSGGGKLFEALYTILWYVGPLNRAVPLDYTGAVEPSASRAVWYAVVAVALLVVGYAGRVFSTQRIKR